MKVIGPFKKILVSLTSLFLIAPAFAQETSTAKYNTQTPDRTAPWFIMTPLIGVNGTAYRGKFKIEDQTNSEGNVFEKRIQPQGNMAVGVLFDYNSHKVGLALQSGVVYSRTKAELDDDINETVTLFLDEYLTIPLMVKLYPFSSAGRWVYFKGGVNVGYLISAAQEKSEEPRGNSVSSTQSDAGLVTTSNTTDLRERVDVQGVFGIGILLPISKQIGLTIEGNYNHGFVNTSKFDDRQNNELFTQGLSGFLGINFTL